MMKWIKRLNQALDSWIFEPYLPAGLSEAGPRYSTSKYKVA